ncbi:MAG: carboxymuconolactone decarboxylase family protein [Terracidiphilus sp.]
MTSAEASIPRLAWPDFQKAVPEFATAMATITHALKNSGVEPEIRELVKIRASQLNGCAFCIQFHLNDARKLGIAPEKLDLLAAWREAGIYSQREAAALEWTEHVTLLAAHHMDDASYERIKAHFPGDQMTLLTVAISQINAWNRVAAPFRFTPQIPRPV